MSDWSLRLNMHQPNSQHPRPENLLLPHTPPCAPLCWPSAFAPQTRNPAVHFNFIFFSGEPCSLLSNFTDFAPDHVSELTISHFLVVLLPAWAPAVSQLAKWPSCCLPCSSAPSIQNDLVKRHRALTWPFHSELSSGSQVPELKANLCWPQSPCCLWTSAQELRWVTRGSHGCCGPNSQPDPRERTPVWEELGVLSERRGYSICRETCVTRGCVYVHIHIYKHAYSSTIVYVGKPVVHVDVFIWICTYINMLTVALTGKNFSFLVFFQCTVINLVHQSNCVLWLLLQNSHVLIVWSTGKMEAASSIFKGNYLFDFNNNWLFITQ